MLHLLAVAVLLQSPAAPAAPTTFGVALESLVDRQVVQRDEHGGAEVRIEGSCQDGLAHLFARVAHGDQKVADEELELHDLEGPRQRFAGTLRLPAGGWFTLRLAATSGGDALFELPRFGVGEVFVIAGQSNSTNFGEERQPSYDDRVSAFDGARWTLAIDPMPGVQDKSQGGSPWPLFGHLLASALDMPVAIASVGFGGTSVRYWQKDHEYFTRDERKRVLFDGLHSRLEALGAVRAILWHQGETDAMGSMPSTEYVALFTKMKADLALDLDRGLPPFVVARASYVPGLAQEKMDAIRAAQLDLWKSGAALQGPDTDDLRGSMRHSKDHIHMSKAGLEAHAARWFAVVYAQFFADPPFVRTR